MPWRNDLPNGHPIGFTDDDAWDLVDQANFAQSAYVLTRTWIETDDNDPSVSVTRSTKYAYTYVRFGDWRLCVVGHIHRTDGGAWERGNCFIPGWEHWQRRTPQNKVASIRNQADHGAFPGDDRYPVEED